MAPCIIAKLRAARGGGVFSARMRSRASRFQRKTTSGRGTARKERLSTERLSLISGGRGKGCAREGPVKSATIIHWDMRHLAGRIFRLFRNVLLYALYRKPARRD